jgi:hydroxyacylglutathione hydrolase
MLTVTPIPAFNDNYIWALHDERDAVLIDPGDATPCMEFLARHGLNLICILVTHHHGDHVGGNAVLAARYHPRIYGPARERIPAMTDPVSGGDTVTIAELGLLFSVIDTPGHTLGHLSYYDGRRLFCGDTLFACGCGRLFEGTPAMMAESLNKFLQLPDETQIFCAHEYTLSNIRFAKMVDGENPALLERERMDQMRLGRGLPTLPSTLALEKATNPFLRCHEPALIHAAETRLKHSARDAVEVFAALRQAKDVF